jgi:hypothetical protein
VYNYHDSQAYVYKRSGILSRLDGLGVEWLDMVFGVAMWRCVIYRTLCGSHFMVIEHNWVVLAYNFNIVNRC